ncbi:MAG: hypothetical protein NWT08_10115 [Akkermansiaceae bacterium]|nr:hypothetical protein [Akkermansiaceae bacterium]MDP4721674.1 hypothetical protein [Akkermansiaceae bacterium]MDP4778846.1 hypothetical protein [Akkermansiaceae bacterium]MDP4846953.1 hypothetical protein [Akkermansiaceae bacterium]
MNFASYEFWKLLFLCFIGSRLVIAAARIFSLEKQDTVSKLCLLATALILLASESWLTLGAFLWVVLLGWLTLILQPAKLLDRLKTAIFIALLIAQLAPLFYYKYWNFFVNEILGLDLRNPSVLIPMGLSFYTFQTIGLWVDNLRNPQPRPSFLNYLSFSSFFPQIVAGPIEKREQLLPQIENVRFRIHRENVDSALGWIVLGLAYKLVVADNLGLFSERFRIDPSNAWHVWLECLTFGMRIYFDFAGYSFIAVGLGLLFGIHLTLNFLSPYWSPNLRDFWRTWHVTLGAWLRDYIYLPLGGRKSPRWFINILIVFLVSGIWHGAGWGFIIWGFLHGIGVALCRNPKKPTKLPWAIRWAATFTYITATWLFFMEGNATLLWEKNIGLINPLSYGIGNIKAVPTIFDGPLDALTLALILGIATAALLAEGLGIRQNKEPYYFGRLRIVSVLLVFLIVFLAPMEESKFIYFNF